MPRILVAAAQPVERENLERWLAREGFEALSAGDGAAGLALVALFRPDLVLITEDLPAVPALVVCEQLRSLPGMLVVFVGAGSPDPGVAERARLAAFEHGADDYLTRPYSLIELGARLRALLRSTAGRRAARSVLQAGAIRIDRDAHEVSVAGRRVHLPLREFAILELLVRRGGRVVTRDELAGLWGDAWDPESKTLEVHIRRIRARIEPDPRQPRHLLTVRGVGYRLQTALQAGPQSPLQAWAGSSSGDS